MNISRYGAYGILIEKGRIFLTLKTSGPYIGQWDLPGGKIEFKETPEEALKREFLEEAAFNVTHAVLLSIETYNGAYEKNGKPLHFHHIGIIYKVTGSLVPDLAPQDEGRWISLLNINLDELTPFAKQLIDYYK